MKPGKWLITIQWGSGMHYTTFTQAKDKLNAIWIGEQELKRVMQNAPKVGQRGSWPTVYVWERVLCLTEPRPQKQSTLTK